MKKIDWGREGRAEKGDKEIARREGEVGRGISEEEGNEHKIEGISSEWYHLYEREGNWVWSVEK